MLKTVNSDYVYTSITLLKILCCKGVQPRDWKMYVQYNFKLFGVFNLQITIYTISPHSLLPIHRVLFHGQQ